MHHGTLLVNADLNSMRKYLKPQFKNIETKAVSSRPASVINLNELNNQITTETLSTSIEKSFIKLFGNSKDITLWNDSNFDNAIVAKIAKKLKSKEWIFDKTPKWRINK